MLSGFRIGPASLTGPVALGLIHELNVELAASYPEEGANHFRLDPTRQAAAIGLYVSAGFAEIERYGEYVGSPLSLCMAKPLT